MAVASEFSSELALSDFDDDLLVALGEDTPRWGRGAVLFGFSTDEGAASPEEDTVPRALRCLDARHPATCTSCIPPPPDGAWHEYKLPCDAGPKALRAMVVRTDEWASAEARAAAAAAASSRAAAGGGNSSEWSALAKALRDKCPRSLAKTGLMMLCSLWQYRSDRWQHKRKRPAAKPPRRPAAAARRLVPPPAEAPPSGGRLEHLLCRLLEATALSARSFECRETLALTLASPAASLAAWGPPVLATCRRRLQDCDAMCARFDAWRACQREWRDSVERAWASSDEWSRSVAMRSHAESEAPAWLVASFAAETSPAEAELTATRVLLLDGQRAVSAQRAALTGRVGEPAEWPAALRARVEENQTGVLVGVSAVGLALQLLALQQSAGLAEYAATAERVLDVFVAYARACSAAYAFRVESCEEVERRAGRAAVSP